MRIAQTNAACALLFLVLASGCQTISPSLPQPQINVPADVPRELVKVTLPTYTVEPPDILSIDAVRIIPLPPYRANTLDVLMIQVTGTLPDAPIAGTFAVQPGGLIQLGLPYGAIKVTGRTLDEITIDLQNHLRKFVRDPAVSVTLAELAGKQQIAGEHLVSPDGTVTLGTYGSVYVVGMTLEQAKAAIEGHLARHLESPEIAVSVFAYNSRAYYVITQGAGLGDGVARFPVTGNETVLDAISQISGLDTVSSKRIWIARPSGPGGQGQILPVDWCGITEKGCSTTNYQVLPGDRIFVAENKVVAFDNALGKAIAPLERLFGATLLGTSTAQRIKFFNTPSSASSGSGFF